MHKASCQAYIPILFINPVFISFELFSDENLLISIIWYFLFITVYFYLNIWYLDKLIVRLFQALIWEKDFFIVFSTYLSTVSNPKNITIFYIRSYPLRTRFQIPLYRYHCTYTTVQIPLYRYHCTDLTQSFFFNWWFPVSLNVLFSFPNQADLAHLS